MTQEPPPQMADNKQEDEEEGSPSPPPPPPRPASVSAPSSARKQLPATPDSAPPAAGGGWQLNSAAAKMLEAQRSSSSLGATPSASRASSRANHSYGPCFLEYSLMAEYVQLQKQKLPGVYVMPSARSALLWNGVLFIRQGLYQEGIFRFSLFIPDNYPDGDCPRLVFEPAVFHPVIDPVSGELDVKRGFARWRRNVNHIWQVLLYARRIFYKIDTKNPRNPEAAVLYEQDLEVYKARLGESLARCRARLYEPPSSSDDPHAIRFGEWDPSVHEDAHKQMLRQHPKEHSPSEAGKAGGGGGSPQSSGLSWMKKGSTQVFSKDDSSSL